MKIFSIYIVQYYEARHLMELNLWLGGREDGLSVISMTPSRGH